MRNPSSFLSFGCGWNPIRLIDPPFQQNPLTPALSEGTLHLTMISGNFLSSLPHKMLISELVTSGTREPLSPAPTPHSWHPSLLSSQVNPALPERYLPAHLKPTDPQVPRGASTDLGTPACFQRQAPLAAASASSLPNLVP